MLCPTPAIHWQLIQANTVRQTRTLTPRISHIHHKSIRNLSLDVEIPLLHVPGLDAVHKVPNALPDQRVGAGSAARRFQEAVGNGLLSRSAGVTPPSMELRNGVATE